jgi:Tfp pilus assembly protein PilX
VRSPVNQRGAALLVALIMLVVFTLLAVSSVNSSTASLRIAGNMQAQAEVGAAAQRALEQVLDDASNFQYATDSPPPSQTITVSSGGIDYQVTVVLQCLGAQPMAGYSAAFAASAPSESFWDVQATARDPRSGAVQAAHQGVRVTLSPGQVCPT